ncbi:hypothetical protein FO519_002700 [Halicephalobus sp. NKZ332]|nr:hypothetical protein FO519_002700 [Halicephalobus sp. NKZ332]
MAPSRLLLVALLAVLPLIGHSLPNDLLDQSKCNQVPLQVVFLFDLSLTNHTDFTRQQSRVIETIRHIDVVAHNRSVSFGFVVFHRIPVLLSPLNSPKSGDSSKVTDQVKFMRPRRHADTSPAKALDLAADQFEKNGKKGAKSIVVLVHDGSNSDLIAETLEAVERLRSQGVEVFAISGSQDPNVLALSGYTRHRERIYSNEKDRVDFLNSLDTVVGFCAESEKKLLEKVEKVEFEEKKSSLKFSPSTVCPKNQQVDLMIILDTSGSVFKLFKKERELASSLIKEIDPEKFEKNIQVGLVSFASEPLVLLPLSRGRTPNTVVNRIENIEFTGMNTRISDAVELGLSELQSRKRSNSIQILTLITDGYGQEFWNQAQSASEKLQKSKTEVFLATTLNDFNFPEMLLYAGDESRIFVGQNSSQFLSTVGKLINRCVGSENYSAPVVEPKKSDDSLIVKVNKETNLKVGQSIVAEEKIQESVIESKNGGDSGKDKKVEKTPEKDEKLRKVSEEDEKSSKSTEKDSKEDKIGSKGSKEDSEEDSGSGKTSSEEDRKPSFKFGRISEDDEVLSIKEKEEARQKADQLRKFLSEQKGLPKSADCDTDLIFVIERSQRSTFNFSDQLDLSAKVVEGIVPEDVDSGKVRLCLVTFSKKSRTIVPLDSGLSSGLFTEKIRNILPFHSASNLEKGLSTAVDEIGKKRRKNARVVIVLVTSGKINEVNVKEFEKVSEELRKIENSDVFGISLNPFNDVANLKKLTGDIWRIFVDARVRHFSKEIGNSLSSCSLAARESHKIPDSLETDLHEPDSSVEKIEHLALFAKKLEKLDSECGKNPIDLVFILDVSPEIKDFEETKQISMDLIKQAPTGDIGSRVKIGITVFNQFAKTIISLNNSLEKDELLFDLERLQNSGGQSSTVSGISQAISDISNFRRTGSKLVIIIVSTKKSKDGWRRIQKTGLALKKVDAEVFGVTLDKSENEDELEIYTSSKKKVFSREKANLFVLSSKKIIFGCTDREKEKQLADFSIAEISRKDPSLLKSTFPLDSSTDGPVLQGTTSSSNSSVDTSIPQETTSSLKSFTNDQGREMFKMETTEEPEKHIQVLFSDDCTVDLMFIIDTSQSVSEEFQKQLQFAVDLVKRLPDEDFGNRVNVATVSFFKTARIEFPFGKIKEKSKVLETLSNIEHTGGSTSAVSGVELAVEEIQRGRRPGAKLMVVLVSDGNSQDLWENVLSAAEKLRKIKADVYAVTVSHDYFFRELELYAGNKWFVYIDARIRQFLDEAELSVMECRNPSIPASDFQSPAIGPPTKLEDIATTLASITLSSTPFPSPSPIIAACQHDIVDLVIVLDTSTSVEKEFYAEKNFALDLIKVLPESDFKNRIRVALVKFNSKAEMQFKFGEKESRNDILYEIQRVEHTGGQTSLISGVSLALEEIASRRRPNSRLVTMIISDGNSQDEWPNVQITSKKLRKTGSEIYAVTLSEKYYFDELKEYTGNERHVYVDKKIREFIQDVGQSVVSCPGRPIEKVTPAPSVEVSVTPAPNIDPPPTPAFNVDQPDAKADSSDTLVLLSRDPQPTVVSSEKSERIVAFNKDSSLPQSVLARDDTQEIPVIERGDSVVTTSSGKCKYSKMDLIIILDASTSRQDVFEHQRELALSLVERLPITKDSTHVATGLNSFTSVPTLRQTLGLGRDKQMVRKAIEDIKYRGGSTLTSKAVELAVKDLSRGRRPDALQVVVLMNDGMSQDPWEKVLLASERLKETGAERFGVALGNEIDLRELRHYIGNDDRIYRDGSTERFLSDIVHLLNGGEIDCQQKPEIVDEGFPKASIEDCQKPKLDVVVVFDATDDTPNLDDPKITSNKYLLLDVLGSLPVNDDVKVSITSFGPEPKLDHKFSDPQDRESIFERIESIQPVRGPASYSKSVELSLNYYNENRRPDARGLLLIVGDGKSVDESQRKDSVQDLVKKTKGIQSYAVDSAKVVDEKNLAVYTGDIRKVYNYDRNADFAKEVLRLATLGQSEHCVEARKSEQSSDFVDKEAVFTEAPFLAKDIATEEKSDKDIGNLDDKIVNLKTKSTIIPPTTSTSKPSTTKKIEQKSTTVPLTTLILESSSKEGMGLKSFFSRRTTASPATSTGSTILSTTSTKSVKKLKEPKSVTKEVSKDLETFPTPRPSLTPTTTRPHFTTPELEVETSTKFTPGCLIDLFLVIDASGSVEESFKKEKELASEILEKFRIGPDNARVSLVKFAAKEKVKTFLKFDDQQSKKSVLRQLQKIPFSSGTTAIHMALLEVLKGYSVSQGARPGKAVPMVVIFTDGFSQKDTSKEAALLRETIPDVFAVAVNHQYPISRVELEKITGDPRKVFTDSNIGDFHEILKEKLKTC